MVWKTVEDLRASALYKRSDTLKTMSTRQLQRFVEIFSAVYGRVTERGGSTENAENTAIAIALSTASRANASLGRSLETEMHFFAAMAPQQFGDSPRGIEGHVFDFSWIVENSDIASLSVAGNEFNWDHQKAHTALGQIRGIVLRKDAPPAVQKRTHKDIPFLVVASYYNDVDPEVKGIKTISAEWASLGEKDGVEIPLPHSFAVTRTPLNDASNGVEKVASWKPNEKEYQTFVAALNPEKVMSPVPRYKEARATMPRTTTTDPVQEPDLAETVASLQKELEGYESLKEGHAALQKTIAKFEGLAPLAEALASLGEKPQDAATVVKTVEASLKVLVDGRKVDAAKIASLEKQFSDLATERATEKANEFAAGLVKAKKIPTDAIPKWSSLFLKDAKMAEELSASLAPSFLGESDLKGKETPALDQGTASLLHQIDNRLPAPAVKEGS